MSNPTRRCVFLGRGVVVRSSSLRSFPPKQQHKNNNGKKNKNHSHGAKKSLSGSDFWQTAMAACVCVCVWHACVRSARPLHPSEHVTCRNPLHVLLRGLTVFFFSSLLSTGSKAEIHCAASSHTNPAEQTRRQPDLPLTSSAAPDPG